MKTIFTLKNSVQLKQESSINGILYLFTTFVLIILSFRGEAQLSKYVHNPSSEINAKDINIAVQSYLDSLLHTSDSSLIMNEGGEYENFQDFKQFWGERLFSEGDFDNYFQSQKQFYSNTINDYSIYNNEPWHELGPTTSSYGIGPVEFVSFYDDGTPLSTKYMLTGSLNSGLFYSSDAGEHWNSTGSDTKWNSSGCGWAVFHPTNHSIWFASSSGEPRDGQSSWIGRVGGIYKTDDEGNNWVQIADYNDFNNDSYTIIYKLMVIPTNPLSIYVATNHGLYKGIENASLQYTWSASPLVSGIIYDFEIKPNTSNVFYISCFKDNLWQLLKSTNSGVTWIALPNPSANIITNGSVRSYNYTIEVSKAKPDYLYCSEDINTSGKLYYCNTNNNIWNFVSNTYITMGWGHGFGVDQASNGEDIVVANNTGLKKLNIYNGNQPISGPHHVDVEDVVFHPYNVGEIWCCTHGGTEKYNGTNWVPKYDGLGVAMVDKMATAYSDPSRILLGTYHDGTILTTSQYNPTWYPPTWGTAMGGLDGQRPLINNLDSKYMLASGQYSAQYAPLNWKYTIDYFNPSSSTYFSEPTYWGTEGVLNKVYPSILYCNRIYQGSKEEIVKKDLNNSSSNGDYISQFRTLLPYPEIITLGLSTPMNNKDYLIVWVVARTAPNDPNPISTYHAFRTRNVTNLYIIWEELTLPRQAEISAIEFDPLNPDINYLVYTRSIDESRWPKANKLVYRIDYTDATDPSFEDITRNLPFTYTSGEKCIAVESSINRDIYLATDFGVFYVNSDLLLNYGSEWQIVGTDLPHVVSHGIEINFFEKLLRVGTFGRGSWEIALPCNTGIDSYYIFSGQNQVWNTTVRSSQTIVIEDGASLTLSPSTKLYMAPNKYIIVKPGGKLIINGALVSNSCDDQYWGGIQVWGKNNVSQLPDANGNYPQGYLELNNATIENALCAVDLWKPGDYLKTGGILKATNSTFRNNTRSIHASHYKNIHPYNGNEMDYFGRVKNCVFEITGTYIPDQTFYKHVDLADIKGFKFEGSDFLLAPNVTGVSEWNQAIAAYSAGFSVQATCTSATQPCSTYDKSKFSGFRYGIYASHEGFSVNTFTVNRAEFENNIYGINVNGIKNETVLNSDFKVGYNSTPGCPAVSGYGIYLDNSTGFAIEENTFTKMPNAPVANYTGIHVNNSQGVNDIYKNSFSNLSFGNSAFMKNYYQNANYGLEYLCNTNQGNWADFYIPLDLNMGNGIQSFQGSNLTSSGNTFSQSDNRWHFYNGGGYGLTYHYNGNAPYDPDPNNDYFELFNVSKSISNTTNQCPSHYGGNGTVSSIVLNTQDKLLRENQYAYNFVNYNNVKTLYDQLRDGGSTQERVSDIETAQPQDMWALRAELLGVSPHLSEEVLRKVADKTDIFTEAVIFDILAANPDELKKEELFQYLENKENPLPTYMIDILRQVARGETYRTVLEKQMSLYRKEMTRAANDMIRSYLNDSLTDYNALRGWLNNLGGIEADKQITATYVQEGNYQQASALANMLPTLYSLTGDALTEHGRYITMLTLYQTLQAENRHLDQLTTNEKVLLEDYANNSSGSSGVAAKGILATYYNAQFVDCMQFIEPASLKKGTVSPEDMAKVYGMEISVKPNPASVWAAFDYILPDMDVTATLQITDMTGKIIETLTLSGKQGQKLWDTRPVKAGVYLYIMKVGIKSLSGKITIIK